MARYPAAAAAPVALLAVLAAATPARAVLAGRPAAIRRGHGGPLCGVRAVGAAAAVLLAVAFAAPASAAPCTPLQLEQFKERYPRGTAPPCAASKLAAVPAACADWAPGAAAPPVAPGATWALANFGTCKASAAAGCAGACATVDGWCLGPYLPTVPGPTFEESTLAGEDSAAGAYCCCPGNPSCQRATAGKTLITFTSKNDPARPEFKDFTDLADLAEPFKSKAQAFSAALAAANGGVAPTVTATLSPALKTFVAHVAGCLRAKCAKGSGAAAALGCEQTCKAVASLFTADLDDQVLARAKGALTAATSPWTQAEFDEVQAYMATRTWLVCKAGAPNEVDTAGTLANAKAIADALLGAAVNPGATINTNHREGVAVDWALAWTATLQVPLGPDCERVAGGNIACPRAQPGVVVDTPALKRACSVTAGSAVETCAVTKGDLAGSKAIQAVGASYGVIKSLPAANDKPHWTLTGK